MPSGSFNWELGVELTLDAASRVEGHFQWACDVQMTMAPEEPVYNPITFPNEDARPWRAIIKEPNLNGDFLGELTDFSIGNLTWVLNGIGEMTIAVGEDDPVMEHITEGDTEIQIRRGTQLIWWGRILKGQTDVNTGTTTFRCLDLKDYLRCRYFNKPDANLISNGSFENDMADWSVSVNVDAAYAGIVFPGSPASYAFTEFYFATSTAVPRGIDGGQRVLNIFNDDWVSHGFTEAADDATDVWVHQDLELAGGPNGTEYIVSGWCYIPSSDLVRWRSDSNGLSAIRYPSNDPSPNRINGADKVVSTRLDPNTATDKWQRHVCKIFIPADETRLVEIRLHGVTGETKWDKIRVVKNTVFENLRSSGDDQAELVMRAVWYAQGYPDHEISGSDIVPGAYNADYYKSDLGIIANYQSCKRTGVLRYRQIKEAETLDIWSFVNDFTTLYDGVDIDIGFGNHQGTQPIIYTYFPHKGIAFPRIIFEIGHNIVGGVTVSVDGAKMANIVTVREYTNDEAGEEVTVGSIATLKNGLTLERILKGTPGSMPDSLTKQAVRALYASGRDITVGTITVADPYGHLFWWVETGCVYRFCLRKGRAQIDDWYRVIGMGLNPANNEMSLSVVKVTANDKFLGLPES